MARFEFEFNWVDSILRLPDPDAPLHEQRAAARAIKLLFPESDLTVYSCTDLEDGSTVRRTIKI